MDKSDDPFMDDRFEFDPEECNIVEGKWVFNRSIKPLYSDRSCPYLDRQVSCVKNGRPDSDYRRWEWQPDDCILPRFTRVDHMCFWHGLFFSVLKKLINNELQRTYRFDQKVALKKLRGKRLMFVGDSLQRGQWQSLVCLVESIIPEDQKSMKRGKSLSVFRAKVNIIQLSSIPIIFN